MRYNQAAPLLASLLLLSGCLADTDLSDGVLGDPSMMTTELGEYDGYKLVACAEPEHWLVIGTGDLYFLDVAPGSDGRSDAVIAFGTEVVTPAVTSLRSLVAWGGASIACQPELTPVSSASVHDWGEIDSLIQRVGSALAERNLREVVELAVEEPIHAL